jgi:hypothetical protein
VNTGKKGVLKPHRIFREAFSVLVIGALGIQFQSLLREDSFLLPEASFAVHVSYPSKINVIKQTYSKSN